MNRHVVYTVTNRLSGKVYVGQTVSPDRRWEAHRCLCSGSVALRDAMRSYGPDKFSFRIVTSRLSQEEANEKEISMIRKLGTLAPGGYNLTEGGGGRSGFKLSAESLSKMAAAKRGRVLGAETRLRMSLAQTARWATAGIEVRKRQSEIFRRTMTDPERLAKWKAAQKPLTDEQRKVLSERAKQLWQDPERRSRMSLALRDPQIRRRAAETRRKTCREPEFRARMSEIARRPRRKYTLVELARRSELARRKWSDPDFAARTVAKILAARKPLTAEQRAVIGEKSRQLWLDPDRRERMLRRNSAQSRDDSVGVCASA